MTNQDLLLARLTKSPMNWEAFLMQASQKIPEDLIFLESMWTGEVIYQLLPLGSQWPLYAPTIEI